jgi:hypothetical protein
LNMEIASYELQQPPPGLNIGPANEPNPTGYPGSETKITLPGTNYCGPGGNGPITSQLSAACFQHDACYATADAGALDVGLRMVGIGSTSKRNAMAACDQQLCQAISSSSDPDAIYVRAAFGCH